MPYLLIAMYLWAGITAAHACYWFTEIANYEEEPTTELPLIIVLIVIGLLWPVLPIVWAVGYQRYYKAK